MEVLQLSALQIGFLTTLIIGVTELLSRLRAKDYWVAGTIVSAAVLGGLIALYYHVDFVSGIAAGFTGSGLLKVLGSAGNKSTPTPSNLVQR